MKILADASLPGLELAYPAPFTLFKYQNLDTADMPRDVEQWSDIEALVCRSTLKVNIALLQHFPSLKVVLTASSGIDHIDADALTLKGIHLFDAKGANAIAVADYVKFVLDIVPFGGKSVVVIGMGFVGTAVFHRLTALGYNVVGIDPYLKPYRHDLYNALKHADIVTLHTNYHHDKPYPSHNLVNENFLNHLRDNTLLINAARGGIVDESTLLAHQHRLIYCTDVYQNEPEINPAIVAMATVATPHIAGHSIEAKIRAVHVLSDKLHAFCGLPKIERPAFTLSTNASPYNPLEETLTLKQAQNLKECFLTLRKAHTFRHELLQSHDR